MSDASSNQHGKASFELDLGRIGFVVIIPVMLWVFYTTFSGLVDIMRKGPDDNFGLIGAVIGSAAILSLMALSSWLLGSELAAAVAGKRRAAKGGIAGLFVIIPSFVFFFGMSAFFSYTYYHANLFNRSARKLTGETQPMELAVAVLPGLRAAVGQANEDQIKKILARQDTLVWMRSGDALIRTARKDNEALAQKWRDEQTKRSDVERQASAEEAKKRKAAQDAKLQIEGIEPRLAERAIQLQALRDQIRPWDERAVLGVEAAKFEAEASFADRGLDRTRVRGCGNEVCKPALKNAADRRKKIADIQKELTPKHDELARVTAEIEVFRKTLSGLREQAAYLSGQDDQTSAISAPVAFDPGSGLQGLEEARREFERDPSWSAINRIKASCDILLPIIREMKLANDVSVQCAPQSFDLQGLLDRRATYAGARKTFDAQCALEGKLRDQLDSIAERVRKKELQPPLALTEAKKIVDGCVALAGAAGVPGVQLSEFYSQANDFVLARSLDRNRFDLATEELFRTPAANKALAVAVAQDMLILIYKFLADFYKYRWRPRGKIAIGAPIDLADDKADPNEIRARKALLRLANPGRDEISEIDDADVDALPAEVAMNLKGLLNGLARRQAVWRVGMGVHGVENSVLFAVESELLEQFGSAPPKPATALPPPPVRTIAGSARDGLAKPLSHSDSLPLLPIHALDFSQMARGKLANTAVGVFSALLTMGRRALSWISPSPPSSLNS
ncbi:MAG TPA: hypothetical protein VGP28_05105 [Methylocella sp.]|jgi:hypothetical protein|nr:hypothetical protein [Methylocella sp.]